MIAFIITLGLSLYMNCISNSNNTFRTSKFIAVILNFWSPLKQLEISVDLERRGSTRSTHGS